MTTTDKFRSQRPQQLTMSSEHVEEMYTERDQIALQKAWRSLANLDPRLDPEEETVQVHGNRDIDLNFSWASHIGRYVASRNWRDAGQFYRISKSREQPGAVVQTEGRHSQLNHMAVDGVRRNSSWRCMNH
ncbi:hypothetical protein E4U32_005027 [Claviceps aff. humidiphila group G2b]|nr:hypothetical protein E4U32_005027 [Claviceps aff. humidiphila group G2b]